MDKKTTGIVAYITWVGLLVAFLAGDKEGAKFHLNQALVLWVGCVIANLASGVIGAIIPAVGGLLSLAVSVFSIVCMVLGILAASKEEEKELPIIGQIKILK
ncbi:MAG: DUF4870 domain-containing protein [Lachnospiraceae bacterium]|nr:DUF4870 domain-containing protein [Lachnospiraceae bacterium]